ncbi:titin-like [Notothenia coriiceps]|uniref:Titin-like n=1 Tax=Notothenia coriiceps TaxID=8208 RepID=A0A6I9PTP6_9TELE|nr:PREDICTED: titin-like [Notothenia coriiceps]
MDTIVKKGQTVLEMHKGLDATDSNPDLDVEELEAVDKLTASAQTESISEVNGSVSTEIVSEVHTEEFDTAEMALDDGHEVDVTHPEQSLKELESVDEIYQLGECLSAASTDIFPPGEDIVLEEGSLVEAHLAETEPPKNDPQVAAGTEAEETRDEAMEQEVQSLTEKEDLIHNVTDQIQVEDKDEPPVEAKEKQELDPEEGRSVQSPEKDIISEDIPAAETHEHKEETLPLTEVNVEPEKEDELQTDLQEQEASEALQTSTLVSEEGSDQSATEEVQSEDFPEAEPVTDQLKQTEECLAEASVEPEESKKDLLPLTEDNLEQVGASRTVEEVLEAEKASASTSEVGSLLSLENEEIPGDISAVEAVTDEPKAETMPCTGDNLEPVDAPKTNDETPEVLEVAQVPTFGPPEVRVQLLENDIISEDVPEPQKVIDEAKEETLPCTDANLEPGDSPKTDNEIPEVSEARTEANIQPVDEDVQESVVLPAAQVPTLDSEAGSLQPFEKEVISEDVSGETKEETIPCSEANAQPVDVPKTSEEPEVLPAILGSEDVIETIPLNKDNTESMETPETEHDQDEEIIQAVQASRSDSEVGSPIPLEEEVVSEDTQEAETVTEEPRDETITPLTVTSEPVEASKTGHIQEPEEVQAVKEATSDSEVGSFPSIEKEVVSEDVREQKTISDEPKEETKPCTEADSEDTSKTVGQQEILEAVETPASDSEVGSPQSFVKEVISEDIPVVETDKDEPKQDDEVEPEERLPEEAAITEHVQEAEVLPSDSEAIVTEITADEGTSMDVKEVLEDIEGGNAQQEILIEGVPKADVEHVMASVTHGIENEVVAQLDTSLEMAEDQNTGSIPQDVVVEQENCVPEVVDEIQTLTAVSVFKDELETSTPLLKDEADEKVEGGSVVIMMHVPSVESEDNQRIQVQVVDVDVKSAERIQDSVLEVVVTEDKEVIAFCHETVTKVFSATPEIEEELINKELKVVIEEVVPHVKENLPEPESVVEQEGVDPPEAVKEVVRGEAEAPKAMEDNSETFRERQEEASTVVRDVSAPEQVSKDLGPNQPESPDSAIIEEKQDLEETKVEQERCKAGVVVEEVKLDQRIHEEAQTIQSPIGTHGNAGIATPHNTGIISSTSTVIESPPSVSIELKLNTQCRRATSQAPDVSGVGVQAGEEPVNQTQRDESEIQVKERAVQETEITEPASDSTERAIVMTPPVLLDIHIQALEETKPAERGTSSVPEAETKQPVKQTERRGVSRSQPVTSGASAQQVEEPVEAKEEDHEQDVWMDAEEDIREETEAPRKEEEEFLERCKGDEKEEKAGLELETAPNGKTEEEERHLESDEDFAVALESPDPETVSVSTM